MTEKKFHLHDSKGGAALAVRVTPRSRRNEIVEVMDNGTVRIRLITSSERQAMNQALIEFLAQVLEIPSSRIEIVAGETGREKLISIIDMDASTVQQRVLSQMS